MANLKDGDYRKKCECKYHSTIRLQKTFVVRTFNNELETHFCKGCLDLLAQHGKVNYVNMKGYFPIGMTTEEFILKYS